MVILGDLLELLGYPLDSIIDRRRALLDRLTDMDTVYVPGNHDEDVIRLAGTANPPHPFFARISHAFVRHIGDRRFKFMHGHEVDPFVNTGLQNLERVIGKLAYLCEYHQGVCILSNDTLIGLLEETGEHLLHIWTWLRAGIHTALRESYSMLPAGRMRFLTRRIRTQAHADPVLPRQSGRSLRHCHCGPYPQGRNVRRLVLQQRLMDGSLATIS